MGILFVGRLLVCLGREAALTQRYAVYRAHSVSDRE